MAEYTMADFKNDFEDCKKQLANLGYELQDGINLVLNNRATRRFGQCSVRRDYYGNTHCYKIELSTKTFPYSSKEEIKNTLMHECIHAIPECHFNGHGNIWKRVASEVNEAYGYKIKRCSDREDKEAYAKAVEERTNYTVKCSKCGHEWHYQRMSKCVKHPELYTHNNCGGHLVNA